MNQIDENSPVKDISFVLYTAEEIKKISVLSITNIESINSLGHYVANGIYDLRLGPMLQQDGNLCETCNKNTYKCKGHCGHIELPLPVYNPVFLNTVLELLKRTCFNCFCFQITDKKAVQFVFENKMLDAGSLIGALSIGEIASQASSNMEEALEVSVAVNGTEHAKNKKHKGDIALALHLKKTLKKYSKNIIKEDQATDSRDTTSNSQSAFYAIHKNLLDEHSSSKGRLTCIHCDNVLAKLRFHNSFLFVKNASSLLGNKELGLNTDQEYLTPKQCMIILRKCWNRYGSIINLLHPTFKSYNIKYPTDVLFIENLLVVPPKDRPCNMRDNMVIEHGLSTLYKKVIRNAKSLSYLYQLSQGKDVTNNDSLAFLVSAVKGSNPVEKVHSIWLQLQNSINEIYDSEMNKNTKKNNVPIKGIRQILEKKEGLIRQNLMGSRVDFSARSVAAPDPMLAADEVGVPKDFAIRLSYPEPVTHHNVAKLRQMVINGHFVHPGATAVETENGVVQKLLPLDLQQRKAIANKLLTPSAGHMFKRQNKVVHRHLENRDPVLMNRQPTLHKASIQAHLVRITNDRVLRLPYPSCKAYNADFDGDELNLHFPQNELARSEAKYLVTSQNQYLTPKDGAPLGGLIQDYVVAGVKLSVRGRFFKKEDYQQLVFSALHNIPKRIELLPPSIMKPEMLWTGKQVISTIMLNLIPRESAKLSFNFKTTVKVDMWQNQPPREWKGGGIPETKRESMTESEFVMRDGELLCGIIDKTAIGSSSYGLVHTCYDLYGGAFASLLMTSISRLCISFLQWVGHTISVKEFLTDRKTASKRRNALKNLVERTPFEVSQKLNVDLADLPNYIQHLHLTENEKELSVVDAAFNSVLNVTTSKETSKNEKKLLRPHLDNNMMIMVDTGAKGSKVNLNQMASLFGSVALDGKRMSASISGKTLPSFKPYDCNPRSGGYIPTRFMTGMDPKSYYFLCIVGRDSLQHTAVKTANSGYMQRCLIKHLEGIKVGYDMTVRNSDGVVLQFQYGEDGLDVSKLPFLRSESTLDVVADNFSRLCKEPHWKNQFSEEEANSISKHNKKIKKWRKVHNGQRFSPFLEFCKRDVSSPSYLDNHSGETMKSSLTSRWINADAKLKESMSDKSAKCPDPVLSVFSPSPHIKVVSEALDHLVENYYNKYYSTRSPWMKSLSKKKVAETIYKKALASRVDPGEAVGAVCAQAIGEPLTQMTLNTFHFAGRDELNVTLGVPRMVEILRTAAKEISTPIMEVPFLKHVTLDEAENFKQALVAVPFAKVVEKVKVTTSMEFVGNILKRDIILSVIFLPSKVFKHVYTLENQEILLNFEKNYIIGSLLPTIDKALKKKSVFSSSKRLKGTRNKKLAVSDDDDSDGDADGETPPKEDETSDESDREETTENGIDDYGGNEEEEADALLSDPILSDVEHSEDSEDDVDTKDPEESKPYLNAEIEDRRQYILNHPLVADYACDHVKARWCQIRLRLPIAEGKYDIRMILRDTINKTTLNSNTKIKKAFVVENDETLTLRTEGVDIEYMMKYGNLLDLSKLYTNDIHIMAKVFGIEAAQRCVIKEIRAVQSAYDIKVDFRHLSLLSDYFTSEGFYKACSRHALVTCASSIQKMTYETSLAFIKQALLQGVPDTMKSPSSNIMVGQPVRLGTNAIDVMSKFKL